VKTCFRAIRSIPAPDGLRFLAEPLRRPPFPGRSTASAVFSVGSCVLSLVDLKSGAIFALYSLLEK
jgi:hypothetical protein